MRETRAFRLLWLALASSLTVVSSWNTSVLAAAPSGKKKPCVTEFTQCPTRGCASPGSTAARLNRLKRTQPQAGQSIPLTLDDFESLQEQADNLVGQKIPLNSTGRKKLRDLPISSGAVSEGDRVQVMGFIVGMPDRPNYNKGGESVNCRFKGKATNDFHIPIARSLDASEFEAIVVEMIPQDRPPGWTLKKLRRSAKEGRPVLVRGQFLYDNMHLVNDDPDDVKGGQPKRFSLWEIHPVSEFLVCMREDEACDPSVADQWTRLEALEE